MTQIAETKRADIYFRELGFLSEAKRDWSSLSESIQQHLQAYSDGKHVWHFQLEFPLNPSLGVNAYLSQKASSLLFLPIEFTLINRLPEPWQPYDSMALSKLVTYFGLASEQGGSSHIFCHTYSLLKSIAYD